MEKWFGCIAVVTGASSGIGAAICEQLVKNELIVIGLARRVERVQKFAESLKHHKGILIAMKCDITKYDEVENTFKIIEEQHGPISILINNAGVIKNAKLMDGPIEKLCEIIDTNLTATVLCTISALKSMKKIQLNTNNTKPYGHIININSTVGHQVPQIQHLNIYPATKHAITAYTEVLRQELRNTGTHIKITSISPGLVQTEMIEKVKEYNEDTKNFLTENTPILKPIDIADAVIYVISTPKHVQVHELIIKPLGEMI